MSKQNNILKESVRSKLFTFDEFHQWNTVRYKDISGASASDQDRQKVNESGGHAGYGEILPFAVNRIFKMIDVQPKDVFLDLGSGTGKSVFQAALQFGLHAYGYELSEFRHSAAMAVLKLEQALNTISPALLSKVHLYQQDMIATDHNYPTDVTVILFDGLLHSEQFKENVMQKIIKVVLNNGNKMVRLWSIGSGELSIPEDLLIHQLQVEKCMCSWTIKCDLISQQNTHIYWLSAKYYKKSSKEKHDNKKREEEVKIIEFTSKVKDDMKDEREKYYKVYRKEGINF